MREGRSDAERWRWSFLAAAGWASSVAGWAFPRTAVSAGAEGVDAGTEEAVETRATSAMRAAAAALAAATKYLFRMTDPCRCFTVSPYRGGAG
jgi:hypothetical protein